MVRFSSTQGVYFLLRCCGKESFLVCQQYDALGQLIRVDDKNDTTFDSDGATWVYEYDQGGNILSKKRYAYTEPENAIVNPASPLEETVFGYVHTENLDDEKDRENKWRDLLKYVNDKRIYYDEIGNPTQFGEDDDEDKVTYTWQNGRQLESVSMNGNTVSFVYNENGLRVQKKLNPDTSAEVVTNYTLHGKNIVHMTQGSNELHFFYDAQNKPAVVVYNGAPYTYVKNLQGDIVAILDSNGIAVVQYKYDAWGRPINCTYSDAHEHSESLGKLNPFRYRGYVYDEETGLYYLRSRYYAASWCRFVIADSILSKNLFVYCNNNPIPYTDADGRITKDETTESPYVYFSYLTAAGCNNIHPIKMDQTTFDLTYTVRPGQYVFIFYDEEDPYGKGVNWKGYYSGGVWAQITNTDEWELIPILIKPKYLTDDLGEVLFTKDIYTWRSDDGRLDEIMPHISRYIDKHGFEPYPVSVDEKIRFYQKLHNCRVDGIVGEETLNAIENELKQEHPYYNGNNPAGYR